MGMIQEFRDFINRGNMLDLAVGVIIGGAFGKIVDSLVKDVITPLIPSGKDKDGNPVLFDAFTLGPMKMGAFINALFAFLVIAIVVFLIVKAANKMRPPAPAAPAGPTDVELLAEIRDLLKK